MEKYKRGEYYKNDLIGKRFGKLVVIERANNYAVENKNSYWRCKCDCGNIVIRQRSNLKKAGALVSCGCANPYYIINKVKSNSEWKHSNNKTGHRGVYYDKSMKLYRGEISYRGKKYYSKRSKDINECYEWRLEMEKQLWGE